MDRLFMRAPVYYIGLATFLLSVSCEKMLRIPGNTPGQLVTSQVFSDSASAVSGVVGIYCSAFLSGGGPISLHMSVYPSLSADDLDIFNPGDPFVNNALQPGNASNPNGSSGFIWNGFYNSDLLYQANACIEGISASEALSLTLKNQLIGECKVIRALCYFYLVNLYGPVPLVVSTDYRENAKLPRADTSLVYNQITDDLNDAISRLTVSYPSAGRARPNKYTAMALLSRVYLFRKEWDKAFSVSNDIINSGIYQLESPDKVFVTDNQEAIWQAVALGFYQYNTFEGELFVPYTTDVAPQYRLTNSLLKSFEPNDQRLMSWANAVTAEGTTYYYPYKYRNRSALQVDNRVEGEVFFRLAEQYLIRAEAEAELGNLSAAADDINQIRSRASLTRINPLTKEQALQAIARERRTEFFCEWGHRWLDLKRTGTVTEVLNQEKPGIWPADGHASLYPVSLNQLSLNPGWKQNPGY